MVLIYSFSAHYFWVVKNEVCERLYLGIFFMFGSVTVWLENNNVNNNIVFITV